MNIAVQHKAMVISIYCEVKINESHDINQFSVP